jgi:hypothetical protein
MPVMLFFRRRKVNRKNARQADEALRREARLHCAPEIVALEARRLFSTINVTEFGAIANAGGNSRGAVEAALNSAHSGDTVVFPAGMFKIRGSVNVPSGVTITGAGYTSTHLTFSLDAGEYGFNLDANDSNVTIEGLDIRSNNGAVLMNQGAVYNNVSIIRNSIEVGGSANGTYWAGIYSSVSMNNGTIDYNYFHDGPSGVRQFSLWQPTNTHVDHNLFHDVWDAGHVDIADSQSGVFSYQYNYGTGIINKGLEAQSRFGPTEAGNIDASYNVFYDWNNANYNTFGLSVPINYGTNSIVSHNYLAATVAPGSSYAPAENGQGQRFGYAIEAAGINGLVEDNTIIGPWVSGIVSSSAGTQANTNAFYGSDAWGYITDEPGIQPGVSISGGTGSLANTYDTNVADAPAPPPNTFAGPAFWKKSVVSVPADTSPTEASATRSAATATPATVDKASERLQNIAQYRLAK